MRSEKIQDSSLEQAMLRRMGVTQDQEGIMRRYIREERNWKGHLKRTSNFIISALSGRKDESVAILGSGWMLDVPSSFLLENFRDVYFCDIRHPRPVVKKYGDFPNAHFVPIDLTGGLIRQAYLYGKRRNHAGIQDFLDTARGQLLQLPFAADYLVSVNLLNQLDILIVDYLKGKVRTDEQSINDLRSVIQDNHLQVLPAGRSCLITDYEEVHIGRSGEEGRSPLLYCQLPEGSHREEWTWEFDNCRSYNPNCNTHLRVVALRF